MWSDELNDIHVHMKDNGSRHIHPRMDHMSADQQNHIHFIMRCIQKAYVKKCLVIAIDERHFVDLDELVAVVTPLLWEEGCSFPETLVKELIIEINDDIPDTVDDE